jgi:hypothetical protein
MAGNGFISDDSSINPHFYNWNKVFVPYCTGLVHTGYNPDPVSHLGL